MVLDRPRHADLIKQIRAAGARIALIADGDVAGAIMVRVRLFVWSMCVCVYMWGCV